MQLLLIASSCSCDLGRNLKGLQNNIVIDGSSWVLWVAMVDLYDLVDYCDARVNFKNVPDFSQALNGLQFEGKREVRKIGAAVDAGLIPFERAIEAGVDFLIVHHGMFWGKTQAYRGVLREKLRLLFEHNISVYSSHIPLDAHDEIGNNVIIARKLSLKVIGKFLPFEGVNVGVLTEGVERDILRKRLEVLFPKTCIPMEFGSDHPKKIAICSGSGNHPVEELEKIGVDTLITGELKQNHYNFAQELSYNLYPCGHYATEVFGVEALGFEVAKKFGLDFEFIGTDCPL